MIGRTLSDYKVLEEISRGGMGIVYKALDLKLNREVALKVLPPELVSDPDRKRRFVQEAQAAAALKHPNIGVIYEIDEVDDVNFIVMELIEGETLSHMLRDGTIAGERAIEIAIDVASGLANAHEKGILHRDLKPGNIMVTRDGHPKIIDFGLAKLIEPLGKGGSEAETAVRAETRSDVLVGTVSYMSPEQALGQRVDARSDLFSLGVVLYEMTTGAKPFVGETSAAVFDAILHRAPAPVRRLNEELPRELEQVITKLLEKEPGARFQSTEELLEALERSTVKAPSSGIVERLKNPWWAVAALAAGVLLTILVVGMVRRSAGARWARQEALPEIVRLVEDQDFKAASDLAAEAEVYIPEDPMLADLWIDFSRWVSVVTEPAGADVYYAEYGSRPQQWQHLGTTPIEEARIPRGFFRWKIEKVDYQTVEAANFPWFAANYVVMQRTLDRQGEIAPGMVKIQGKQDGFGDVALETEERIDFDAYWLDKCEVTSRQANAVIDETSTQGLELREALHDRAVNSLHHPRSPRHTPVRYLHTLENLFRGYVRVSRFGQQRELQVVPFPELDKTASHRCLCQRVVLLQKLAEGTRLPETDGAEEERLRFDG